MAERLGQWVGSFEEIQEYAFSDLQIQESDNLAICFFFNHVKAIKEDKTVLDMWWRERSAWRKQRADG